jgi:hypothetical protein
MGLVGWLKNRRNGGDPRLTEWRRAWTAASSEPDRLAVTSLGSQLDAFGFPEEEIEIEREMLDGISQLVQLRCTVEATGIPIIETGHRVVGRDTCHFSTPVSMPDDASQPSGRLFLTNARVIFAGGARATTVAWHAVGEVVHGDRDVVLVRRDRDTIYRFRCNSFADAMCGAFLARRLASTRTRGAKNSSLNHNAD